MKRHFRYQIIKTKEFSKWYDEQNEKTQTIIDARLERIAVDGHFGITNEFDGIIELKWKSGLRIYTFKYENTTLIVLLGGNKNGQTKDINFAKKLIRKILETS